MMKRKKKFFSTRRRRIFLLRINIHKDWLRDHTSWAQCGIEMKIKGILKFWFWFSLHQGMLFILCSRIQGCMLSLMNKVDPWLLLPLCVLYEMQNQIFQQVELLVLPMRIYSHNISLGIIFLGKMKLEIIFKKYVKWVTNLNY